MYDLLVTSKFRKYILIAHTAIKDICSLQFLLSITQKEVNFIPFTFLFRFLSSSVTHEPGTESMHSNELKQIKEKKEKNSKYNGGEYGLGMVNPSYAPLLGLQSPH